MATVHWTRTLNRTARRDLYNLYIVLFNAKGLPLQSKQRSFEAAADGKHSWPIVGFTRNALVHLCTHGSCDGMRRAHRVKRYDRAQRMFGRTAPLSQTSMLRLFFQLDAVVVTTAKENGIHGDAHWSPVTKVPTERFTRNGMKAVATPDDLAWAIGVLKAEGVEIVPQYTPKASRARRTPSR